MLLNPTLCFILLVSLFTWINGFASEQGLKKNNDASFLAVEDKTLDGIGIGHTSLVDVQNKYGGLIWKKRDAEGIFNSLCLIASYGNEKYLLKLSSGAMGGWETITEYELSRISTDFNDAKCGRIDKKIISRWIGATRKTTIDKYGTPTISGRNFSKYEFKSQENDSLNSRTIYVYAGIYFYFNNNAGKVFKIKVFEVKST